MSDLPKVKRNILLNPGPSTTTDTVKYAQVVPDICPREKEFADIMKEMRKDLVKIVHGDLNKYTSVMFCGSGTVNIDACLSSLLDKNQKALVIINGSYSERARDVLKYYNIPYVELFQPLDALPDLKKIEEVLKANTYKTTVSPIKLVYVVHQETGSGLLNPIKEIGALAHKYDAILVTDTTSTYAMLPIDIEKDNIDFLMASAQKGLMAMTGMSFVVGRKDLIEKSKTYPKRSYYTNLYMQYEYFEKTGQMHFTPPVQTIYATRQGIKEYFEEGEEKKYKRHMAVMAAIHKGEEELGLKELLKREIQSGLVSAVQYPDDPNFSFEKVHDYCYERGYTIYPGKIEKKGTFRLCSLGAIKPEDVQEFWKVFKEALEFYKVQIPVKYN